MSPRRTPPPYLRLVREPSHRPPAARGKGARRGFGKSWWGQAWVDAIEGRAQLDPNRLPRGRGYARSGAVGDLDITGGLIRAQVQGSRREPYDVTVRVRVFDDAEWDRVLGVIAAQVGHAAALLDGEVPPSVAEDARAAGLELLPGPGEVQPRCSCPDWADPCKHAAAVCYLVADVLDEDPFALLRLRGRGRDEVLTALRRLRSGAAADSDSGGDADARDLGVPARAAFADSRELPPLPSPPLPPSTPGRAAALESDPPVLSGLTTASLEVLATDAAIRAHELLIGDDPTATGLDLDVADDVVRRVAVSSAAAADVAQLVPCSPRDLEQRAQAWRIGGRAGVHAVVTWWEAPKPLLDQGAAALGPGARRQGNRVTRGEAQLRLDEAGRWHPFVRVGGEWRLIGNSDEDPALALSTVARHLPPRSP
jgi:uncharacterized Zn finger protein